MNNSTTNVIRCAVLAGVAAASGLLGACAAVPETPPAPRAEIAAEPVTGSNIPRRDRKSVSGVTVLGPEAARDILNKSQAPLPTN